MRGRFSFPVDLEPAEEGGFVAHFPDLPEAVTQGDDRAEALAMADDCLEEALAGRVVRGDPVPMPSPAAGRPLATPGARILAKVALALAMREQGMSKVELAARLGIHEREARRILDPASATKLDRLEQALAVVGLRLVADIRAAA